MSDKLKTLQSLAMATDNTVIRWAADEIDRLREEQRSISTLLQKVESLEADNERLRKERDTLLESQLWGVACKPTPPGPEGDGNG